jgi:hypothetical protein
MDNFWQKVNKNGPIHPTLGTRCWTWMGSKQPRGYGYFRLNGKVSYAHRVAWFLTHKTPPRGHCLHRCDNPSCVRPSHLGEGSAKANTQDMVRKNRQRFSHPRENNGRSKLTEADVKEMRNAAASGRSTPAELALAYGLHKEHVSAILRGRFWKP